MDGVNKKILAGFQGLKNKVTKKDKKKDKRSKDGDKDKSPKEKDKAKIAPEKSDKSHANGTSERLVPSGVRSADDHKGQTASDTKSSVLDKDEPEVNALEQLPAPTSKKLDHITVDRPVQAAQGKRLPTRKTPAERAKVAAAKALEEETHRAAADDDSLPEPDPAPPASVISSSDINEPVRLSPQMQMQAQMIAQAAQQAKLRDAGASSSPSSPAVSRAEKQITKTASAGTNVPSDPRQQQPISKSATPQYSSTPLGGEKIIKVFLEDDALKTVTSPPPCTVSSVIDHLRKKMYLVDTTDFVLYETKNNSPLRILDSDQDVYNVIDQWQGSAAYKLVFKKAEPLPSSPPGVTQLSSPRAANPLDVPGSPKSPRSGPASPRGADYGGMRNPDEFEAILAYDPFASHIGPPIVTPASRPAESQPPSAPAMPSMPELPPPDFALPASPPPALPANEQPSEHGNPPQPLAALESDVKKVDIDASQFPAAAAFLASLNKKPAAAIDDDLQLARTIGSAPGPAKPPAAKLMLATNIGAASYSSVDPKSRAGPTSALSASVGGKPAATLSPALSSGSFAKKPPRVWTADEVGEWLDSVGLHEHRAVFFFKGVAGQQLMELTSETIERDMLTPDASSRDAVMKAIENLKAERLNLLKQIRSQPSAAPTLITAASPPASAPAVAAVAPVSSSSVATAPAAASGGSTVIAPVAKLAAPKGKPMAPLKPAASPAPNSSPAPGTSPSSSPTPGGGPSPAPPSPRVLPKPAAGVAPLVVTKPAPASTLATAKPAPGTTTPAIGIATSAAKPVAKPAAPTPSATSPAKPPAASASVSITKPAASDISVSSSPSAGKPAAPATTKPSASPKPAAAQTVVKTVAPAAGATPSTKPPASAAPGALSGASPNLGRTASPVTSAAAPLSTSPAGVLVPKPVAKMAATPATIAKAGPVGLQVDIVNDAILRVYFSDSVWRAYHLDGRVTADELCALIRQRHASLLPPGVDPNACVLVEALNVVNEKPVEGVSSPLAVCKSWTGNSSRFMFKDRNSGPPKTTKEVLKVHFADGTSKACVVACTQTAGELCTQMAETLKIDSATAGLYALYEVDDSGDSRILLESDNVSLVRSRWLVPDEAKLVYAAGKPSPPAEPREPSFSVLLKTKPHAKTRALVEQSRSFAAWANYHLAKRQKTFDGPLDHAMRDSTKLVALVELLGGRPLPNSHANPTLIRNKLENIQNVVTFFTQRSLPTPKDYYPEDIMDGNVHALLALLWPLVYTSYPVVFKPVPEAEARKVLLEWCRERAAPHGVDVDDFDFSFRDGAAFAAILATCKPELLDFAALKASGQNMLSSAIAAAESAGVPKGFLIQDAFNHTEFNPDERAVFAYLTVYYRVFSSQ